MINSKLNSDVAEKILVFIVTCSRSKARQSIERQALLQLAKIATPNQIGFDFIFFDNNSNFKDHLKIVENIGATYYASENRGLWSALYWLLKNELSIFQNKHRYIHLVESDMFIKDLVPLTKLPQAMDQFPYLHMVRTQEFSIKNSWRFDKKYSFLPSLLHNKRSEVDLRNTTDNSYFRKELIYKTDVTEVYSSNLNAKLPGLHKTESLKFVIDKLAQRSSFSESDFFKIYAELSTRIGIIDKGIWYSLTDSKNNFEETASWGDKLYMKQIGYQDTRHSMISNYQNKEIILHE